MSLNGAQKESQEENSDKTAAVAGLSPQVLWARKHMEQRWAEKSQRQADHPDYTVLPEESVWYDHKPGKFKVGRQ